jgi:hypothetical protein
MTKMNEKPNTELFYEFLHCAHPRHGKNSKMRIFDWYIEKNKANSLRSTFVIIKNKTLQAEIKKQKTD